MTGRGAKVDNLAVLADHTRMERTLSGERAEKLLPSECLQGGTMALLHGRLDEADRLAGDAMAGATAALGQVGGDRSAGLRELLALRARARTLAGRCQLERFDYARARQSLLAARSDWRHWPDSDPLGAAATEAALASLFWLCDEPDDAVQAARTALRALATARENGTRLDAVYLATHLAFVDVPGRSIAEIRDQLVSAHDWLLEEPAAHPLEIANVLFVMAMIEQRLGHHREAARVFDEAGALRIQVLGEDHPYVGYVLHGKAQTALDLGDFPECVRLADGALHLVTSHLGPEHPNVTTFLLTRGMGVLLGDSPDRFDEARKNFDAGLKVSQTHFGQHSPQNATAWLMLGVAHYAAAAAEAAEETLHTALHLSLTHPRTRGDVAITALRHLFELWRFQGRYEDVVRAAFFAVEVWTKYPTLSPEPAVRWAMEGAESALEVDDERGAHELLDLAWAVAADSPMVGDTLLGALERIRRSVASLRDGSSSDEPPDSRN